MSLAGIYEGKSDVESLEQDPVIQNMGRAQIESMIVASRKKMESAAAELDFMAAARYRDEMNALKQILETK